MDVQVWGMLLLRLHLRDARSLQRRLGRRHLRCKLLPRRSHRHQVGHLRGHRRLVRGLAMCPGLVQICGALLRGGERRGGACGRRGIVPGLEAHCARAQALAVLEAAAAEQGE